MFVDLYIIVFQFIIGDVKWIKMEKKEIFIVYNFR